MFYAKLKKKILIKKAKVCIVGLGYVGYPLLQLLKKKNIDCVGIDSNQKKFIILKKIKIMPKLFLQIIS